MSSSSSLPSPAPPQTKSKKTSPSSPSPPPTAAELLARAKGINGKTKMTMSKRRQAELLKQVEQERLAKEQRLLEELLLEQQRREEEEAAMHAASVEPPSLPPPPDTVEHLPFPDQARCPLHRFEPLLWYCATCRVSLCTICRIEQHSSHETMSFETITAPTLRRLSQLEREVESRQATLNQIDVPRLVDRLCSTVESEIKYLDDRLIRRCEEIKQDVLNRAARMREQIEQEMSVCQDYLMKVEDAMDVMQCINVGEEPSQHPLFVPLMNGHISCSHFFRAAAPVDRYVAPRIVDGLRLLELPITNTLEACRNFDWTTLSASSVPQLYPRN